MNKKIYFSLLYLFLVFLLKTFQIFLIQDFSLFAYLPYFLVFDLPVLFFIFLFFDLPFYFILNQTKWYFIIIKSLFYILFFFIILYTGLMVKFFLLFGNYLSYGHLMQAHKVESFQGGISKEFDSIVLSILIFSFLFLFLSVFFHKKKIVLKTPLLFKKKVLFISLTLFIFIISSLFAGINKHDFYSLDKNPFIELFQSSFFTEDNLSTTEQDLKDTQTNEAEIQNKTSQNNSEKTRGFDSRSILNNDSLNPILLDHPEIKDMNLVFIIMESTFFDYTDLLKTGDAKITPNLKKISENALVLPRHYTPEPATLKALFGIFTGKYPYQTNFRADWRGFVERANKKELYLGNFLQKKGYETAFFTTADGELYSQTLMLSKSFQKVIDAQYIKTIRKKFPEFKYYSNGIDDRILIPLFEEYLDQHKNKKFFAALMPLFPHHPYEIPSKEFEIVPPKTDFDRYLNSLYCGDFIVGKFYEALEKRGLLDKTLFVIVSDHGEAFFQHPRNYIHSLYLYEENLKTTALISHPLLFKKQKVFEGISRHIDLFPTLLSLLGFHNALSFDGVDLTKNTQPELAGFYTTFSTPYAGIRDGKWKYIYNIRYKVEELYDLEKDPFEKNNLASQNKDLCTRFRKKALELVQYTK